ncbi:MAG: Rrf2 family transcriptional regulator [Deltaproteobacteria bacterium]
MKISRETDYAIRCLLQLARRPEGVSTVREISGPRGIPPVFLAKILQKLGRAGMTESVRGARGGFRLARDPAEITLLSVIEAVEGPLAPNDCLVEGNRCSQAGRCSVHPVWRELRETLAGMLAAVTLRQLAEREGNADPREYHLAKEGT